MSLYQHGKRTRNPKNPKIFLSIAIVTGVTIVVAAFILSKDIGNSTAPKTNVPIVTNVGEDEESKLQINEKLFIFSLPSDWKLQSKVNDENTHHYVWVSTKKGASDRKLTLYVDTMPAEPKIVRLQPVSPSKNKLILGNISGECLSFAGSTNSSNRSQATAPFKAKWENITFLCDPIQANQTIGTGSTEGGTGVPLTAGQGRHSYFFFYQDHNTRPDDRILVDALKSFEAK
ncbi:MAG: hypothetical protein M3Q36_00055 [bacterium]|nr:hypothetical protein [bacterium]